MKKSIGLVGRSPENRVPGVSLPLTTSTASGNGPSLCPSILLWDMKVLNYKILKRFFQYYGSSVADIINLPESGCLAKESDGDKGMRGLLWAEGNYRRRGKEPRKGKLEF